MVCCQCVCTRIVSNRIVRIELLDTHAHTRAHSNSFSCYHIKPPPFLLFLIFNQSPLAFTSPPSLHQSLHHASLPPHHAAFYPVAAVASRQSYFFCLFLPIQVDLLLPLLLGVLFSRLPSPLCCRRVFISACCDTVAIIVTIKQRIIGIKIIIATSISTRTNGCTNDCMRPDNNPHHRRHRAAFLAWQQQQVVAALPLPSSQLHWMFDCRVEQQ